MDPSPPGEALVCWGRIWAKAAGLQAELRCYHEASLILVTPSLESRNCLPVCLDFSTSAGRPTLPQYQVWASQGCRPPGPC